MLYVSTYLMLLLFITLFFFFFKQKTAYEMRISDWSSDVCSSDLPEREFSADQPWRLLPRSHIHSGDSAGASKSSLQALRSIAVSVGRSGRRTRDRKSVV